MKNLYVWGILMGLVFLVSGSDVYAYSGLLGTCSCGDGTTLLGGSATDACVDCSAALNDNTNCANQVNYVGTVAITNYTGTCINNLLNFNNKVFDCQGHTIDGDNSGYDYGIYLNGKSNNTIKNCVITDFGYGIRLDSSSNNTLTNNTLNNNTYFEILLISSSNNTLTNNTLNNNSIGILLDSSSNNTITNNILNNNINYGIELSSSSNNTLTNNTGNNNNIGILLSSSSNNTLTNNTANNNNIGILLSSSSNNTLTNNTANNNNYGIYSYSSSNNIINMNHLCSNTNYDINIIPGSVNNTGDNNLCETTYNWNDTGTTGCTWECIPNIQFIPQTPANGTIQCQNWMILNLSVDKTTPDTIKVNWNGANTTIYDSSLVLGMNFDNVSGENYHSPSDLDIVKDFSKYGNDGTTHNNLTYNPTGGKYNGAFKFDGVNDYVSTPDANSLDVTTSFTHEVWIKFNNLSTTPDVFAKSSAIGYEPFRMNFISNDINLVLSDTPIHRVFPTYYINWNLGKWYHIVTTFNNGEVKFYIDGELKSTVSSGITSIYASAGPLYLGARSPSANYVNGTIDEVRIYNRSLSADEVKEHYLSNLAKHSQTQFIYTLNQTPLEWEYYNYSAWVNDTAGDSNSTSTNIYANICPCGNVSFTCPSTHWKHILINGSWNCGQGFKNADIFDYNFTRTDGFCEYNVSCNPGATVQCYHAEGIPLYIILALGAGGFGAIYYYYRRKRK